MIRYVTEVARVFRKRTVLASLVIFCVGGLLLASSFTSLGTAASLQFAATTSYDRGYHISVFVFQSNGAVVAKASVAITIYQANASGPALAQISGATDSSGFARLSWQGALGHYRLDLSISSIVGSIRAPNSVSLGDYPSGETLPGPGVLSIVTQGTFVVTPHVQICFVNPDGSIPTGLVLAYNLTEQGPAGNETSYVGTVGPLSGDPTLVRIPLPESALTDVPILIELLNGTGFQLVTESVQASVLRIQSGGQTVAGAQLESATEELALLSALEGVFIGYAAYGEDRLTGAIEPVLALPITRTNALTARYIAALAVIVVAGALAIASMGLTLRYTNGLVLPAGVELGLLLGSVFQATAFLGLIFLLAHTVRGQGGLLAIGGGAAVMATVMWPLIQAGLRITLGFQTSSTGFAGSAVSLNLLNPTALDEAVVALGLLQVAPGSAPLFSLIGGPAGVVAALISWLTLPVLSAIWLARHRD